jgi:hypothetical protein
MTRSNVLNLLLHTWHASALDPIISSIKLLGGDSLTLDVHIVTIRDGVWANNLATIAKMLEDVDYKDESNV